MPDGNHVLFFGSQDTTDWHMYQIWDPLTNEIKPFAIPKNVPSRPSFMRVTPSGKIVGLYEDEENETKSSHAELFIYDNPKLIWPNPGKIIDDIRVLYRIK